MRPFDSRLSLALDRAILSVENSRGLRRIIARLWLRWLSRSI